jgi:hypothetical protein
MTHKFVNFNTRKKLIQRASGERDKFRLRPHLPSRISLAESGSGHARTERAEMRNGGGERAWTRTRSDHLRLRERVGNLYTAHAVADQPRGAAA